MRRYLKKYIFILCLLCAIFGFRSKVSASSDFWVEFVDVGQGDCALIQCDGHYMLIDGGPSDESSTVYTLLKNKGITNLDYMIATHPDADHVGGLSGALNYASVQKCYCSVTSNDTKTFNSFLKYLNRQNVSITVPDSYETFMLSRAEVQLIMPRGSDDTNNGSIITKITYNNASFLFMADAEYDEEAYAVNGFDLSCDVLKVGHHGSSTSTSAKLLNEAAPLAAVISVGKNNPYGHPFSETLSALDQAGATIFRTDLQGDIYFECNGSSIGYATEKDVDYDKLLIGGDTQEVSAGKKITRSKSHKSSTDSAADNTTASGSEETYVLNTNTKKFHYPSCSSVSDIKAKNRQDVTMTRDDIIANGYQPCKRCNP